MRIYIDSIGCRLNQSEIETFARQFSAAGHSLVSDPSEADLAVINTCTVTAAAAADSRKKIRGMSRAGVPEVVVTGCWSTLEPEKASELIGVIRNVKNAEKDSLVPLVLDLPPQTFETVHLVRKPIPGSRLKTRAFLKVQDGCDNRCAFCITTIARGPGKSLSIEAVLKDVQAALDGDAKEIVLTGVHMGSWGNDFPKPKNLPTLVETILKGKDVPRLRLSSLEPWDIDDDFFDLWSDVRLARHLHLPLQSGCGTTLHRMARKITPEAYADLLAAAREAIPGVAITTDVIVGFPGETDDEFSESLAFVEEMEFARGHVFTYSERPETLAARMSDAVPYPLRKTRNALMRKVFEKSEGKYQRNFLDQEVTVLWETAKIDHCEKWSLTGLSDNYLRISAESSNNRWNQFNQVKLVGINGRKLIGKIIE